MSDPLVSDLRQQIAGRQVVAIIGAGVSIGATGGAEAASWTGLLRDGIRRCESVANPRPKPGWGDRQRAALDSGDLDDLLGVAEQIESKLGGPEGGEYRRWLRESLGALALSDRAVLEALRDLGVPIATTNYDDLIEQVTFLPPVTWRDGAIVQRVIRGDEKGILHLHGHWKQPESVILGIRSYEAVLGDQHAQTVQAALALMRSFLFIGCGEGLADPKFGALLRWMRQVFAGAEYRHFRLCLDRERDEVQGRHPPEERVFAVPYGPGHQDLAPFLRRLRPAAPVPRDAAAEPGGRFARLPARPRCFGRDALIEDLVGTLLLEQPPPTPVLGGPGFGKSTLCLAALHDPRVAGRFGERRYFVRGDGADTAGGILTQIALTLDLPVGLNLGQRVDRALAEARTVLVLYRRVGSVRGEAHCIFRLGDVALARPDPDTDTARARFEEALELFSRIPEPYSIGGAHWRLARIAASDEERRHVRAAREAWRSIRRDDLVRQLDAEFGGAGGGGGEQA